VGFENEWKFSTFISLDVKIKINCYLVVFRFGFTEGPRDIGAFDGKKIGKFFLEKLIRIFF
jgi:hypothetical protein